MASHKKTIVAEWTRSGHGGGFVCRNMDVEP